MKELVIVIQKADYADEFDIEGFSVMEKEEWEERKRVIEETEYPTECYFGSNEYMEFSSASEVFSDLTVSDITEEEYRVITKFFGERDFGIIVLPDEE